MPRQLRQQLNHLSVSTYQREMDESLVRETRTQRLRLEASEASWSR